jgi:16S rRNA (cytidine1402-2'-O)-methyltransferase
MIGTLYIVATPIGNLEDITFRAIRVLKEVDLIACEDTRHTRKLLSHYEISKPTISYHEHNERERASELIRRLEAGESIALVSDAGTPLISDPGFRLVSDAASRGIRIVAVPGPSALIAALSASGVPAGEFIFAGFLPSKRAARVDRLEKFKGSGATLVFYEAPHRIRSTIEDAQKVLGNRDCVIARELTKIHETFLRGALLEIEPEDISERGEFVLIFGPPKDEDKQLASPGSESILKAVERHMSDEGLDQKAAIKRVARELGIGKSQAYRLLIEEQNRSR